MPAQAKQRLYWFGGVMMLGKKSSTRTLLQTEHNCVLEFFNVIFCISRRDTSALYGDITEYSELYITAPYITSPIFYRIKIDFTAATTSSRIREEDGAMMVRNADSALSISIGQYAGLEFSVLIPEFALLA